MTFCRKPRRIGRPLVVGSIGVDATLAGVDSGAIQDSSTRSIRAWRFSIPEVYDCATGEACKLINISSRGYIGQGDSVAIPVFVVAGNKPKKLLVRGVGPTLGSFGVPATIADPTITLYNASQAEVASNDNWGTYPDQAALAAATAQVFAFALSAGSTDAAMIVTVNPGSYTVVVSGNNNGTGVALVEVYEIE